MLYQYDTVAISKTAIKNSYSQTKIKIYMKHNCHMVCLNYLHTFFNFKLEEIKTVIINYN